MNCIESNSWHLQNIANIRNYNFMVFFLFLQCGGVGRSSLLYVVVAARVVGSPVSKYSRNALCV